MSARTRLFTGTLPYAVQTFLPSLAEKAIARFVVNAKIQNIAAREYGIQLKVKALRHKGTEECSIQAKLKRGLKIVAV